MPIGQYWGAYGAACDATRGRYPFEMGYHVMLGVIGVSLTAEYGIKAIYENTVGRTTEWLFSTDTPEDVFAAGVAAEYGQFMHTTPWYQFPFADRLGTLLARRAVVGAARRRANGSGAWRSRPSSASRPPTAG